MHSLLTPWIRRTAALTLLATLVVPPAAAADDCREDGHNLQCNGLGTISMDAQRDVRGEPIQMEVHVLLTDSFADQGARWVLFSVRNSTSDSPVWIQVDSVRTDEGDVQTTRVEKVGPSQTDLWVDVLDLPVGKRITLHLTVGATERGAYRVETLVMPFDRGYASVPDREQEQASLFSFTLLGVNGETAPSGGGGGGLMGGHKLPGPGVAAILAITVLGAAGVHRRRWA